MKGTKKPIRVQQKNQTAKIVSKNQLIKKNSEAQSVRRPGDKSKQSNSNQTENKRLSLPTVITNTYPLTRDDTVYRKIVNEVRIDAATNKRKVFNVLNHYLYLFFTCGVCEQMFLMQNVSRHNLASSTCFSTSLNY